MYFYQKTSTTSKYTTKYIEEFFCKTLCATPSRQRLRAQLCHPGVEAGWKIAPNSFKDNVSKPKKSGYQAPKPFARLF